MPRISYQSMQGNTVAMGQHERLAPCKTLKEQALAKFGVRLNIAVVHMCTDLGRVLPKNQLVSVLVLGTPPVYTPAGKA